MKKIVLLFIMPLAILMADFTLTSGQLMKIDSSQTPSVETGGIPPEITGTIYYVANDGDDSNNGTSPSTPWKTIQKVNNSYFNPGDGILFKRGDTWIMTHDDLDYKDSPNVDALIPHSGSSTGYLVYGAYGTGSKPLLTSAIDKNSPGDWTQYSTNKWQTTTGTINPKLNALILEGQSSNKLVFNNNINGLTSQGDHCHNYSTGVTTVYSVGNPANFYNDIRVSMRVTAFVTLRSKADWFIVDGIEIRWMGAGMYFNGSQNFKIRNNTISWIGGKIFGGQTTKRYGNGITIYSNGQNAEVYNNIIWQCYDTALSAQKGPTSETANFENLDFHHNILHDCAAHWEYHATTTSGNPQIVRNIKVQNNIMYNAGGWKMGQSGHSESWGKHVIMWSWHTGKSAVPNGYYFRNNIMWKNHNNAEDFYIGWPADKLALLTVENNTFTKANSKFTHPSNKIGDPLFNNAHNGNFTLQSESITISSGIDIGYNEDFTGNSITSPYNIGAY